jgi:peptidoglycan/LPS O-acetylase OafA/YrhL
VLSGFVMALSYARFFKNGIAISDYKTFMVNRLARVYPLYIFITLVFLAKYELNLGGVWIGYFNAADFIACALMVQAWGFGSSSVARATCSLSREFFAYIIFPVLISFAAFAIAERHIGNFAHPLSLVAVTLLSLGFACVLYRFIEMLGRLYVQRIFLRPGPA